MDNISAPSAFESKVRSGLFHSSAVEMNYPVFSPVEILLSYLDENITAHQMIRELVLYFTDLDLRRSGER